MLNRMSPFIFATVFSAIYTYAVIVDWTLFRYYPLINQLSVDPIVTAAGTPDRAAGPAMHWFAWIVTGLVPALVLSMILPRGWTKSIERHVWIPALIAVIVIFVYERRWLYM